MMARIKIKHPNPSTEIRILLMSILSSFQVYATRIIPAHDEFAVTTRIEKDIDKIFKQDVQEVLNSKRFSPVLPLDQSARRTVLVLGVDEHIFQNTEDEIKEEIKNKNEWIKEGVDNLLKFNKKNIMKIQLKQSSSSKKKTEQGILAYMCMYR